MYLAILFIFIFLCLEFAGRKGCEVWVCISSMGFVILLGLK